MMDLAKNLQSIQLVLNIIFSARFWITSICLVSSLVRLVCHAGQAYSKTGRITEYCKKKYSISSAVSDERSNTVDVDFPKTSDCA